MIVLFSLSSYADDVIVAKVNGTALTQKDLEDEVDRLIPQMTFHKNVSTEKRKNYYGRALEEMIERELEYQDALAKGMKPDKEKVEARLGEIKKRYKSNEQYKNALSKDGLTEEQFRSRIEKQVLIESVITKVIIEPSQVNETELKEYYEKNISKFKQPESARMKLISTKDEKKAQDILVRLKAGEDFSDLAYTLSEDAYRVKGGDIGYIHKGRMLPEIDDAAFKLKVGETSAPIKAGDFWYIIRIEDKKPEHQNSFEEIKGKLENELEAKRAAELKKKWIEDIKAKAKIEVLIKTES
jgi:peptidyl-prolyl cis-trans isomerase C